MKNAKKLIGLLLVLIFALAMSVTAFAQDIQPEETENQGSGTITVSNAAKGETYKLYRLFDAFVSAAQSGGKADSIAYTGIIPDGLKDYFSQDAVGNISATDAAWKDAATKQEISEELQTALESWAEGAADSLVAEAVSDGSTLKFTNLKYGYYVLISSQGAAITVDSTNPNATIVDKNSSTPSNLSKAVNNADVNIGDTVTYTVRFKTSNYTGAGTDAKRIVSYTIHDTLSDFLTDVKVTSIVVDDKNGVHDITAQFVDKSITLAWYDKTNKNFLYDNHATVTIQYTAVVTDKAAIDGAGNINEVTLTWTDENDNAPTEPLTAEETIYTYAIALKKVDQKGNALAGATFEFPFYVKETPDTDGAYIYGGTEAGTGLTNTITTPEDGAIVVKGVKTGDYSITETTAPAGYNRLTTPVTVKAVQTGKTTTKTTFYLDENGDVVTTETQNVVVYENINLAAAAVLVVNKTGALLPTTGGIGTTIFYVVGSILLVGAAVLLITKKRMNSEK